MTRVAAALHLLVALSAATLYGQATPAGSSQHWRYNGTCYEIFIRSYFDSNGDGVGDLRGLTRKLDYINDGNPSTRGDLGANCIWLMPVMTSPSYHGYDVTNYYAVNGDYGSNEDFKEFAAEAHKRGIRILVDLILNHSSSEHPFFRSALLDPQSAYRDWYHWSPAVRPSPGWQAPVWHKVRTRDEYYYGLFWAGMPDLNLAHPAVRAEAEKIARFWIEEMGADGFRLDAVGHFFEEPDGQWKNGSGVYPWLRDYAAALHRIKPDIFTIGEVWDTMGAVLKYYPDQLDAYFAFEVADAIFEAVRNGSGARLVSAVQRAQREIPDGRWGMFLRNHDQTRTLTEFSGDVARNKLAVTLLLTLPGVPFVYYGEEIGMTGAKPAGDIRLRTPMHWSRQPAAGFTNATPWEPLPADSFTANVEALEGDANSLLNLHRQLIHLRASTPALGATAQFIPLGSSAPAALAYLRRTADGRAAVIVANLTGQRIARVRLSSADGTLAPARYTATTVHGSKRATAVRVGGNGRIQDWAPVAALGPYESVVIELARN